MFENKAYILEALRFGLVPPRAIRSFTIGYDQLAKWALETLERFGPSFSLVTGPYGSGKSHALAVFRQVAEERGFLVSGVSIDREEVRLTNPPGLFYAIAASLTGKDFWEDLPVLELFRRSARLMKGPEHIYYSWDKRGRNWLAQNMKALNLLETYGLLEDEAIATDVERFLSGDRQMSKSALEKKLKEAHGPMVRQIGLNRLIFQPVFPRGTSPSSPEAPLAWLEGMIDLARLAQGAGYRGLAVTIDEVDVEATTGKEGRRADAFLQTLVSSWDGRTDWPSEGAPLYVVFAQVDEEGGRKALIEELVDRSGGTVLALKYRTKEELWSLNPRILSLYGDVYRIDEVRAGAMPDRLFELLSGRLFKQDELIRSYIKWLIAMLDLVYGPPKPMG